MQIGEISKEQVLEAAIGAKTVTEVARRLKLCDAIMSGKSGKILRGLVEGLDDIVKQNREATKASTVSQCPSDITNPDEAAAGCPYSRGLYRALFIQSNMGFQTLDELVARLSAMGHKESSVRYAWAVLKNPRHSSNNKRSTALIDGNRSKLIALSRRRPSTECERHMKLEAHGLTS